MKLDCEVIRDLLPLYAEHLTSPASTQLVEEHLKSCESCRAELAQMQEPVPVRIEPEPAAPLLEIKKGIDRRQKNTVFAAVVLILLLAAAVLFGYYAYLANDRVTLEEVQVAAYFQQETPGVPGWVLQARGEGVYLKINLNRRVEGADLVIVPVRYRYAQWHAVINKIFGAFFSGEKELSKKTQRFLVGQQTVALKSEDETVLYKNACRIKRMQSEW